MSMFVSKSLDYALRSLIFLAEHPHSGPANLREISSSASIPRSYLAKLMRTLVQADLVLSDAGARGGYRLARSPHNISLLDVYECVEGSFRTIVCEDGLNQCELHDDCSQVAIWDDVKKEILDVLNKRNLSDFVGARPLGKDGFVPIESIAN